MDVTNAASLHDSLDDDQVDCVSAGGPAIFDIGSSDSSANDVASTSDVVDQLQATPLRPGDLLTPEQARQRRRELQDSAKAAKHAHRVESRSRCNRHRAQGRRPLRERPERRGVTFISANVTGFGPLQEELEHGITLRAADYLLVQEHAQHGEARERATLWMQAQGWDCVSCDAYRKTDGFGGGTAAATQIDSGIRPLPTPQGSCDGRFAAGIIDYGGDAVLASFYGLSGLDVSQQLQLWKEVAAFLRTVGLPFIIGGDWQVMPDHLAATGLLSMLRAAICAPREATNLFSGNVIDWFVVSECLVADSRWTISTLHGTNFATHVPVRLSLQSLRGRTPISQCLASPKPFPINKPLGPKKLTAAIDWSDSPTIERLTNIDKPSESDLGEALECWYSGFEFELGCIFDTVGTKEELKHLGVGEPGC